MLLEQVEIAGRLTIDLTELRELADERETEIERYLAANEEVGEVVQALEQQYDAFERAEENGSSLLASDEPLPTGEEIGRQFEQFLAGLDTPGRPRLRTRAGLTWAAPTRCGTSCSCSTSRRSTRTSTAAPSRRRRGPGCTAGRWPRRRWWPASAAWTTASCRTRSTPTSCCPATTPSRSSSTSSGSATVGSFLTRRVTASQHGRPIYHQTINFQRPEEGFDHQDRMPDVPGPEAGFDLFELMRGRGNADADELDKEWASIEVRFLGNSKHGLDPDPRHPSQARMWVRFKEGLPEDPMVHLAAFTYASDISLLGASLAVHDINPAKALMASLDHTLWFHRPFRADEWWLYDQWSPSAHGGRGLAFGHVYTADGTLVATAAQEGVIRSRRPEKS